MIILENIFLKNYWVSSKKGDIVSVTSHIVLDPNNDLQKKRRFKTRKTENRKYAKQTWKDENGI